MASMRRSARLQTVTAACGHQVSAYIPPGNLGQVGRRNIAEAQAAPCRECRQKSAGGSA